MPGERRGGRKPRTLNRRTILTDRILALAPGCPGAGWRRFVCVLAADKALPADTRVATLKSLSTGSGRKQRGGATDLDLLPRASHSGNRRALTKINSHQLEGLLRVVQDENAAPKDRRKAALAAALLLFPVAKTQKKWGALTDKFGIAINPGMVREYRDIKLRLKELQEHKDTPSVQEKIKKLRARKGTIFERVECPCASVYGVKDISQDRLRLNRFAHKRIAKGALTDEEEEEEAHRQLRIDLYEASPEVAAVRRRKYLDNLEGEELEALIEKRRNPFRLRPNAKANLRLLRLLYPERHTIVSPAEVSPFETAEPDGEGNLHAVPDRTEQDGLESPSIAPDNLSEWFGSNTNTAGDGVDLEAWLRGAIDYPPYQLKDAARKRLGKSFSRVYPDLIIDCVKANLVSVGDLREDFRQYLPERFSAGAGAESSPGLEDNKLSVSHQKAHDETMPMDHAFTNPELVPEDRHPDARRASD